MSYRSLITLVSSPSFIRQFLLMFVLYIVPLLGAYGPLDPESLRVFEGPPYVVTELYPVTLQKVKKISPVLFPFFIM